jgi:alcohol dehydrogenase class IV
MIYSNTLKTGKIIIGWGAHETVGDECKAAKIKKALVVTTGLHGTGIVEEITQILSRNKISTELFDKVTSNTKDYEVMEAYKIFKDTRCDGVVSIGGGSSHDCGKCVRVVADNDGRDIRDFAAFLDPPWREQMQNYKTVTIPQISINTTAGTSAESSAVATITNMKARAKQIIFVEGMGPTTAIVDPLIIRLMPAKIAAWTGFDALAHGFEGFLCRIQVPHSLAMFLQIVKMVSENLREFACNRMNHVACEKMCWAESMAGGGLMFGGGQGIVHGFGHQLSAVTDAHHGLANAVMTLPLERYNEPACPERFAEMARAMGVDTTGMTKIQAADKWFDEIERLLKDLNIETGNLSKQFGLEKKDIEHIVKIYSNDFTKEGNPRDFDFNECVKLLESML